jgi:hypothetical protein
MWHDFLTVTRFHCCHREGHAAKSALNAADLEAKTFSSLDQQVLPEFNDGLVGTS